jgi:hypothetical protein
MATRPGSTNSALPHGENCVTKCFSKVNAASRTLLRRIYKPFQKGFWQPFPPLQQHLHSGTQSQNLIQSP